MLEKKMAHKLSELMPQVMFQTIESSTGLGIPDIFYGRGVVSGWIELKQMAKAPANGIVKIPWRPGQFAWYKRYKQTYHILQPYILCLTIGDDWFMMRDLAVKQSYLLTDLYALYYIGKTNKLKYVLSNITKIILN